MENYLNDFQSLPEYVGTIRDDIQKVLDDNAIVKSMISNLQTEVATDIAQLSNRIDTNTSAINTTNTNLNSLTTKVNNNSTQLNNIQTSIVFINNDIRDLTERIDTIDTSITAISAKLDTYAKMYISPSIEVLTTNNQLSIKEVFSNINRENTTQITSIFYDLNSRFSMKNMTTKEQIYIHLDTSSNMWEIYNLTTNALIENGILKTTTASYNPTDKTLTINTIIVPTMSINGYALQYVREGTLFLTII